MQRRLDGEELTRMNVDPHEPCATATCPFCGALLVMGVRMGTRNVALAHEAIEAALTLTGEAILGCEVFRRVAQTNAVEFLRLCKSQGVKWKMNEAG